MYEVVVIGAGQLGSRHLQGLAPLHATARLHMVDPSGVAIEQAKARLLGSAGEEVARIVVAHRGISTLPKQIDVVIIATTADRRFAVLSELLAHAKIRYILLEKVLFQKFSHYEAAGRLIEQQGALAWVNCPRRLYPIYRTIKGWFAAEHLSHVEVAGGGWGLGCNGIHFVDLFMFLTQLQPMLFDVGELEPGLVPARRAGSVEYSGTMRAQAGDRSLVLTAKHDSPLRHFVTLRSEQQYVVIDESGGRLWRCRGPDQSEFIDFRLPYQSEMTGQVVSGMLESGKCGLADYKESAALHLPFLQALAAHGCATNAEECLVT